MTVITWEMPKSLNNVHDKIQFIDRKVKMSLESVPTPTVTTDKGLKNIDFTDSPSRIVSTIVESADESFYFWMSKTETTDFMYRASVHAVSEVVTSVVNVFN